MQPKFEIVRFWLLKSQADLAAARRLLLEKPPLTDAGCLHCQQAAEKAAKAFLQLHQIEPPKTHSLRRLATLVRAADAELADILDDHEWLTPFAADVRYPPFPSSLSVEVCEQTLAAAERLVATLIARIPLEARP